MLDHQTQFMLASVMPSLICIQLHTVSPQYKQFKCLQNANSNWSKGQEYIYFFNSDEHTDDETYLRLHLNVYIYICSVSLCQVLVDWAARCITPPWPARQSGLPASTSTAPVALATVTLTFQGPPRLLTTRCGPSSVAR